MTDYSFAVRQQHAAEMTETADRFYFEVFKVGDKGRPSILCEVRRCDPGRDFEIIVWKDDNLVLGGEKISRKSLEDLALAIEGIL